jgi:hypothetical protein
MQFQSKVKVLGMKSNKGTMDGGQSYDSTKVYVETPLDDSKGNAKGYAVAEYTLGLSTEFEKFKALAFPFEATATLELVTTGKVQKTQMTALVPIVSKGV